MIDSVLLEEFNVEVEVEKNEICGVVGDFGYFKVEIKLGVIFKDQCVIYCKVVVLCKCVIKIFDEGDYVGVVKYVFKVFDVGLDIVFVNYMVGLFLFCLG